MPSLDFVAAGRLQDAMTAEATRRLLSVSPQGYFGETPMRSCGPDTDAARWK